jgi:hypothetical protein
VYKEYETNIGGQGPVRAAKLLEILEKSPGQPHDSAKLLVLAITSTYLLESEYFKNSLVKLTIKYSKYYAFYDP